MTLPTTFLTLRGPAEVMGDRRAATRALGTARTLMQASYVLGVQRFKLRLTVVTGGVWLVTIPADLDQRPGTSATVTFACPPLP